MTRALSTVVFLSLSISQVAKAKPEGALAPAEDPNDLNPESAPPELHDEDGSSFSIAGFSQLDYLRFQRSSNEISDGSGGLLNENQFRVRRARVRVDKSWGKVAVASVTELVSGTQLRQVNLEAFYNIWGTPIPSSNHIRVRAGLFPVPFTYESFDQTAPQRFFGERTLFAESFIPGRFDLGVAASGHVLNTDWIVALQNGEPLGSTYAYRDPNDAKDLVARVHTHGSLFDVLNVSLGSSVIYGKGFSAGTQPTKDRFEWRDLNEDGRVLPSELISVPGSAGRPSQDFTRWGVGLDAQLSSEIAYLGKSFVYGECAFGVNLDRGVSPADPVLLGRDQRGLGCYAAYVQEVTRHATLGFRFERYDPNMDDLELAGGITVVSNKKFSTLSSGVAYHLPPMQKVRARILAEYEYQRNQLGRDSAGRPDNADNNTLRIRFEVKFRE